MSEARALLVAGAAHLGLLALLSVGLQRPFVPSTPEPEAIFVEFEEVGDAPMVREAT